MAEKLYKLGRWSAVNRWKMIVAWVLILGILITLGLAFKGETTNELSIPGTESQDAVDMLNKEFPSGNSGSVQVIFKAPQGQTLEDEKIKEAIMLLVEASKKDTTVMAAIDPYSARTISQDKRIGYANLYYSVPADQVTEASKDMVLSNEEITKKAGIQTELGGTVVFEATAGGNSSEAIGILMAYVILGITFMSMIAAGIPILTAIIGVISGMMIVQFGSGFISMSSVSSSLALMLGLAVGIDYALLIISRVRQEAGKGKSVTEAIAIATATAGSAVIFAGITVMIALLGLAILNIPFLTIMGAAAALTVFFTVCVAITLVPALLSLMGNRIIPKRKAAKEKKQSSNNFGKWARVVSRYPVFAILGCLLLIGTISYPGLHMKTGFPDNGTKSEDTTERRGYDLLAEGFGPGFNGPIMVVVHSSVSDTAKKVAGIVENDIKTVDHVVRVSPPNFNPSGTVGILSVIPSDGPTSDETLNLVESLREHTSELESRHQAEILLTGQAVMNIDVTDKLNAALPIFIATIVGLGLVILAIVFRSVLVPIKAVVGFLFTICSSLGAVVFVFQDGHLKDLFGVSNVGPILNFLPVMLVGIIFGLAMDYQVFLVTRMREDYSHSGDARNSVITGMEHNGPVVTSAGLIMISVFSSFIFTDDQVVKSMGLALAVGVLVDAFIVRMTLVPAIMSLLGKSAWYLPKWLDRIIPNVDIEGESLMSQKSGQGEAQHGKIAKPRAVH